MLIYFWQHFAQNCKISKAPLLVPHHFLLLDQFSNSLVFIMRSSEIFDLSFCKLDKIKFLMRVDAKRK